ncbi:MAG TPA: hypothetical protein VHT52_23675, partial [Stellaceae bacterium]|nr:hypothetical protein [Stellaceae bacterium]
SRAAQSTLLSPSFLTIGRHQLLAQPADSLPQPCPIAPILRDRTRRPGVLDRFIQQAVLQVLRSQWDATFSPSSYGLSAGPLGASGGGSRATLHCRGAPLGGGHRTVVGEGWSREASPYPDRLSCSARKTWMAGTRPGKTVRLGMNHLNASEH